MAYLIIIRPLNLLLIVLVQVIIKYGLLETHILPLALDTISFGFLVFATVCIAAAGNVINDIMDVAVDRINKPQKMVVGIKITERAAYNYYMVLSILGVGCGFYLANSIDRPQLAAIFIVISVLLYLYATHLKAILLVGNLLISLLVAMSLIVLILFDIYPMIEGTISEIQTKCSRAILLFAGFAFYINLIREIVKDLQDIDGDRNGGRSTLPIVLGRKRTTDVVFVMGAAALLSILIFTYTVLYKFQVTAFYFVFLVGGPLLFFCIKAWKTEHKKHYKLLSTLLKVILLLGVVSLMFYAKILSQL